MDKLTFEIALDSIDEIIEALNKHHTQLFYEQEIAKSKCDYELRNKLLTRFMVVQDLLSMFESKKMEIEKTKNEDD